MDKNQMELLSPAGAWESMLSAVQNGADAIYLGGRMGNARQFADNFCEDSAMRGAIDYCHQRGVRVYVALNTLLLDRELQETLSYAGFLFETGADACIVQDLGLVRLLGQHLPGLELHASTQMAIHDAASLAMCETLGIRRAVLARELSLQRIRALHETTPVELECFGHGALCTAVSGMCLFSSLAGGRSGNRGACAQPCRKGYRVDDAAQMSYPLSLEDLCMLLHVPDLQDAGCMSIKLEGRMKRPEYVGAMTRAYRMAIDGAPEATLREEWNTMQRIFFRGGSTGYYYAGNGKDIPAGVEAGSRAVLSANDPLLQRERARYAAEHRQRSIKGNLTLHVGEPASLSFSCAAACVCVQGEIVEEAKKPPDLERYRAQIAKLGNAPFVLEQCAVDMPTPAHLPVSALNALRRQAADALCAALSGMRSAVPADTLRVSWPERDILPRETRVLAIVPDAKRARAAFEAGATDVALEPRVMGTVKTALLALQNFRQQGQRLLLQLPAVDLAGNAAKGWKALFENKLLDGGVAQHASQAAWIQGEKIAGYLCNASNTFSVLSLRSLGFACVLLSLELNRAQSKDLLRLPGTGLMGYGRAQLMQLWHCPHRQAARGCMDCSMQAGSLTDEAGRVFMLDRLDAAVDTLHASVSNGGCLLRVRNCETMDILDQIATVPQPGMLALEFFEESEKAVFERVRAAIMAAQGEQPAQRGTTRGHWNRGWQNAKRTT